MFKRRRYLVFEFLPVDGCTASACAGWISGLEHEGGDYAVKELVVVVGAGGEGAEVFAGLYREERMG